MPLPNDPPWVAIVGGGPAGLMAASTLTTYGIKARVFDAMPSLGRKFLMAGKSGLNITHAEPVGAFLSRYGETDPRLRAMVATFGAPQIVNWANALGIETFTGSTGRVFPTMMKASPLLRAWLGQLQGQHVTLHPRHRWTGWDADGRLQMATPTGDDLLTPDATLFALGGGSWARLGSDGQWAPLFAAHGLEVVPFAPSNCGLTVSWSPPLLEKYAGMPIKGVRLRVGGQHTRGESVITQTGLEGGGVYTLSPAIRDELRTQGQAQLWVDLMPDRDENTVAARLAQPRGSQSMANHLRKTLKLTGVRAALLREGASGPLPQDPTALAALIKQTPLTITGTAPLDTAISTSGGVAWAALDDHLMVRTRPGTFCAGEMIDWDAPTGGYLLTACLATGHAAGMGIARWLATQTGPSADGR